MDAPILEVDGLSKRYCRSLRRALAYGLADIWSELLPWRKRSEHLREGEFWALEDVSFSLGPGEALAVVGTNGAGKSTLLRILAGLIQPDAGLVRTSGTVQSIIELGGNFNPALSGRENARLSLVLAGQRERGASASLDEVIAFAELGDFIDAPLQSYSSGMRARLAFALAVHRRCDLLLVDEVLAVGDIHFQRKCVDRVRTHLEKGGALVFVSHDIFHIQTVCRRGLMLDHGRVTYAGTVEEAINRLLEVGKNAAPSLPIQETNPALPRIDAIEIVDPTTGSLFPGAALTLRIRYSMPESIEAICVTTVWTRDFSTCITIAEAAPAFLRQGAGERVCTFPRFPLAPGSYYLCAAIVDPATLFPFATLGHDGDAVELTVLQPPRRSSLGRRHASPVVELEHHWE